MAQGFPDYFGELVLPVSVPNGGTGRQSLSTGFLLVGNGTSIMNEETPKSLGLSTSVSTAVSTGNTGPEDLSLGTISAAGLCRLSANVSLKNASGNAISVTATAVWHQNGTVMNVPMFTISSSAVGSLADGAVKAIYPDTGQLIGVDFTVSGFGAGDSYDFIANIEQLP